VKSWVLLDRLAVPLHVAEEVHTTLEACLMETWERSGGPRKRPHVRRRLPIGAAATVRLSSAPPPPPRRAGGVA
jgi:hypothetical protein